MTYDIASQTEEELRGTLAEFALPSFRARQIAAWLRRGVTGFDEMTDLPAPLRAELAARFPVYGCEIEKRQSARDGTAKYLYRLRDGEQIETVLMRYKHGASVCVSTQAGCRMGCAFCATGLGGLRRNLTASEMSAQIMTASRDQDIRVSHAVLMGMGEPLDNFENVLRFLELVGDERGAGIGMRHISLSTCGLTDEIDRLRGHRLQLTLSVSLHAPDDGLRRQLMPITRKYPLEGLMRACRAYAEETGRRISYEYAMIDSINDSDACARELASLLRGTLAHVNLIPINRVEGARFVGSPSGRVATFAAVLSARGIPATVRRTLGADIAAACGQLRGNMWETGAVSPENDYAAPQ